MPTCRRSKPIGVWYGERLFSNADLNVRRSLSVSPRALNSSLEDGSLRPAGDIPQRIISTSRSPVGAETTRMDADGAMTGYSTELQLIRLKFGLGNPHEITRAH